MKVLHWQGGTQRERLNSEGIHAEGEPRRRKGYNVGWFRTQEVVMQRLGQLRE